MIQKLKNKTYNLLRWSEKYTKTDMVYLAKGGFWLTFGQAFLSFLAFMLSIAYANFLSMDSFGIYKYALSIAGILSALTLTGLGTALSRAVAQGFHNILKSAFWTQLKWSWLMLLASIILALYYFINDNYVLATSLVIIGLFSPISQSAGLYISFLNGKKDFKLKTKYDALNNLIPFVFILITIILTNNPLILIFVYFASYTLTALFFYYRTNEKYPGEQKIDNEIIGYSKHLSLMNILGAVALQIDKILIFHYLGAIQLAIYTFALAPATQFSSFLKSINVLSLPKLSNQDKDVIKKTLPMKMLKFSLFLLIPVTIYILLAPYFYKFLFPQYIESIKYSQFYILNLLFFPQEIMKTTFIAQESKKTLYYITTIGPIVKIILLAILLPLYGIAGSIAAILTYNAVNTVMSYYYLKKS